eukprot:748439-Hanusia_phi.AAC.1
MPHAADLLPPARAADLEQERAALAQEALVSERLVPPAAEFLHAQIQPLHPPVADSLPLKEAPSPRRLPVQHVGQDASKLMLPHPPPAAQPARQEVKSPGPLRLVVARQLRVNPYRHRHRPAVLRERDEKGRGGEDLRSSELAVAEVTHAAPGDPVGEREVARLGDVVAHVEPSVIRAREGRRGGS